MYKARYDAFGWNAIIVDGHDIMAVCKALLTAATTKDKPTALIAKTLKGYKFSIICVCAKYSRWRH